MKKTFEIPAMEMIEFTVMDVITTSTQPDGEWGGPYEDD